MGLPFLSPPHWASADPIIPTFVLEAGTMTKFDRTAKLIVTGATAVVFAGMLAACSKGSSPAATQKQELSACSALPEAAAAQVMGEKLIAVPMSTSANSNVQMCQYVDPNNETAILLQISPFTGQDAAGTLKQDAQVAAGVSKNSIIPGKIVPASGLGDGAFFAETTTSPTDRSVQLHFIEAGHKLLIQINNPKTFTDGENLATGLAQQAVKNIQDGKAFEASASNG